MSHAPLAAPRKEVADLERRQARLIEELETSDIDGLSPEDQAMLRAGIRERFVELGPALAAKRARLEVFKTRPSRSATDLDLIDNVPVLRTSLAEAAV